MGWSQYTNTAQTAYTSTYNMMMSLLCAYYERKIFASNMEWNSNTAYADDYYSNFRHYVTCKGVLYKAKILNYNNRNKNPETEPTYWEPYSYSYNQMIVEMTGLNHYSTISKTFRREFDNKLDELIPLFVDISTDITIDDSGNYGIKTWTIQSIYEFLGEERIDSRITLNIPEWTPAAGYFNTNGTYPSGITKYNKKYYKFIFNEWGVVHYKNPETEPTYWAELPDYGMNYVYTPVYWKDWYEQVIRVINLLTIFPCSLMGSYKNYGVYARHTTQNYVPNKWNEPLYAGPVLTFQGWENSYPIENYPDGYQLVENQPISSISLDSHFFRGGGSAPGYYIDNGWQGIPCVHGIHQWIEDMTFTGLYITGNNYSSASFINGKKYKYYTCGKSYYNGWANPDPWGRMNIITYEPQYPGWTQGEWIFLDDFSGEFTYGGSNISIGELGVSGARPTVVNNYPDPNSVYNGSGTMFEFVVSPVFEFVEGS